MSAPFKPFPPLDDVQARAADPGSTRRFPPRRDGQDPGPDRAGARLLLLSGAGPIDPLPDLHQGRRRGDGEPHRRPARDLGADAGYGAREGAVHARRQQTIPRPSGARAPAVRARARRARAACASRPSTPSRNRCSRPSRPKPGLRRASSRSRAAPSRSWRGDARRPAGRCRSSATMRADRRRSVPEPAAREKAARSIISGLRTRPRAMACARARRRRDRGAAAALIGLPEASVEDYLAPLRRRCVRLRPPARDRRRQPHLGHATGQRTVDDIDAWLALPPIDARGVRCPICRWSSSPARATRARSRPGQRKAEPDYDAPRRAARGDARRIARRCSARPAGGGHRRGAARRPGVCRAYAAAKRSGRRRGLRRPDRLGRGSCWSSPGWAIGCATSSTSGADHILVDEAQDTNARAMGDHPRAGRRVFQRARRRVQRHRTIVHGRRLQAGDLRLPGHRPARASTRRAPGSSERATRCRTTNSRRPISATCRSTASFRSAQPMLAVVDAVIDDARPRGARPAGRPPRHDAHHASAPGWSNSGCRSRPRRRRGGRRRGGLDQLTRPALCGRARRQIRDWLDQRPSCIRTGRALTAGDILILVRRRGELAVADRRPAVRRGRAGGGRRPAAPARAARGSGPARRRPLRRPAARRSEPRQPAGLAPVRLGPGAAVRRRPWPRKRARGASFARAQESDGLRAAHDALGELARDGRLYDAASSSKRSSPARSRAGASCSRGSASRRATRSRSCSPRALEFERNEAASLHRFLAWFARGDVEIVRDPSAPRDAVRVMTVHGAKGLEAPVVILADARPTRTGAGRARRRSLRAGGGRRPRSSGRGRKSSPSRSRSQIARQDRRDREEHWRLLYVALTRAEERLYIGGSRPAARIATAAPGELVRRGRGAWRRSVPQRPRRLWGSAAALRRGEPPRRARSQRQLRSPPRTPLPDWARRRRRPEARRRGRWRRRRSPTTMTARRRRAGRCARRRSAAPAPRLFERLPEVAPDRRRRGRIAGSSARRAWPTPPRARAMAEHACRIIADPRFADLFGPRSLAEAPIAAPCRDGRVSPARSTGCWSRSGACLGIDFKTGRGARAAVDIPAAHLRQMAAYGAALRVIFPGRTVEAALLYTRRSALLELDA